MQRTASAVAALLAVSFFVSVPVDGQFVLRDDVAGWEWLDMVPNHDAVVQLVRGTPQTGQMERLDAQLLAELRRIGVRRVWEISDFDATESSVVGECSVVDWAAPGSDLVQVGLHAEVSFWDHTKLSATEIYESISFQSMGDRDVLDDVLLQTCVTQLSNVLFRLGYNQG